MREYSIFTPMFWIGETGRKIQAEGMEAVIVAAYLISSPHSHMLGLFYCPIEYIAADTGLTIQGASKGLTKGCKAGFCAFDEISKVVWVFEMARHQVRDKLSENDKRVAGIRKEYKNFPKCPFLGSFFDKYKDLFHLNERREIEGAYQGACQGPSKPGTGTGAGTGTGNEKEIVKEKVALGKFENVIISEKEVGKLNAEFGEVTANDFIERLSEYLASSGKKYKSHYATILSWNRKDQKEERGQKQVRQQQKTFSEIKEEKMVAALREFVGGATQ